MKKIARIGLGSLLLTMALGQALNLAGFADILQTYSLGWDNSSNLAIALILLVFFIAGEGLAGLGLVWPDLAPNMRRRAAGLGLAVAVVWGLLALQAFGRGLTIANCGCFGVFFGQKLSIWILFQDIYFITLAFFVWRDSLARSKARVS